MFKFIYRKKLYVADDGLTMYIRGVKTEKKEGEAVEDRNDLESEKEIEQETRKIQPLYRL